MSNCNVYIILGHVTYVMLHVHLWEEYSVVFDMFLTSGFPLKNGHTTFLKSGREHYME